MKWLKRFLYVLAAGYLLVCGLLYFYQDSLILHPRPRSAEYSYGNYEETYVDLPDGERLNVLRLPATGKATGAVLYLHGNRGDNGRSLYQTRNFPRERLDLWLVDYRGFGKSSGLVDGEEDLTEDLQEVYDAMKAEYGERNIILAGYSLGSGPASYLAAENEPKGLVLVAPYTSLTDMKNEFFWMFPDFLLKYELNNEARLAQSSGPVVILHGTDDELIPYAMGERLEAVDPKRIKLEALPGVGHRGAILNGAVGRAVEDLWSE